MRVSITQTGNADVKSLVNRLKDLQNIEDKADSTLSKAVDESKRLAIDIFAQAVGDTLETNLDGYSHIDQMPSVDVSKIEHGYRVEATGEDVLFLEFGTGIYYNGSGMYPEAKPTDSDFKGIGEYGKNKGRGNAWGFYGEYGNRATLIITHGNRAYMPMYKAKKHINDEMHKIFRGKK